MPRRRKGAAIDGVFLLDKAQGVSSNNALQQVRHTLSAQKAGHTGSLDPLATGLLPICLGEATKVAGHLLDAPKSYRVTAAIGAATDTGDAEGRTLEQSATDLPDNDTVDAALSHFVGDQYQIPPMYSALKHHGRPLYEYARAGQTVPREARPVRVERLTRIAAGNGELELALDVSAGTYVRQLVADIAVALGRVAHVTALRRVSVGALGCIEQPMNPIETLRQHVANDGDASEHLVGLSALLADWPAATLDERDAHRLVNGGRIAMRNPVTDDPSALCRVHDATGGLIAIGACSEQGVLQPKRVFVRPQS
ncbi:tRNA pseudouridine(55) synthase TruB [Salinisphaera sp. USBA-960]|uniref:tRNA pseudouridine(55) synthase TruB n=1 Tax=Salinisphaera orenii TaxID=856731 RepID=UPI000DBE04B8|nr:tRNA pseudouridine(55) synthase TruB [Salifodinibacter halophilus]NNC25541.1 tRNA pseudouridine(55) synthase TruB [Salifodinibacter halophilus]